MELGHVLVGLGLAVGILVIAAVVNGRRERQHNRELLKKYEVEWNLHQAGAFVPRTERANGGKELHCYRLAAEVESTKGQLAVLMNTPSSGWAIQHINKNGQFAKKGPYFVSRKSHTWRLTGRHHLVCTVIGRFAPDHYAQKGEVSEYGLKTLEVDTRRYNAKSREQFLAGLSLADARALSFPANSTKQQAVQVLAQARRILEVHGRCTSEQLRRAYESKLRVRSADRDWYSRVVNGECPVGVEPARWAYQVMLIHGDVIPSANHVSDD